VEYARVGNGVQITYRLHPPESTKFKGEIEILEEWQPLVATQAGDQQGWSRRISLAHPPKIRLMNRSFCGASSSRRLASVSIRLRFEVEMENGDRATDGGFRAHRIRSTAAEWDRTGDWPLQLHRQVKRSSTTIVVQPAATATPESFATVPGYSATRLPLPQSIMRPH